ncbi:hypothetical protein N431DRAFT_465959 [Stipitochalara longipes BDJ]|nr:hypothetical protein N431DRAFT_465959 [Stipitochalara longipes BDJ]
MGTSITDTLATIGEETLSQHQISCFLPLPLRFTLLNDSIVTSDGSITIAFGIISVIISLLGVIIAYLSLRAMVHDQQERNHQLATNEAGFRHQHIHYIALSSYKGGLSFRDLRVFSYSLTSGQVVPKILGIHFMTFPLYQAHALLSLLIDIRVSPWTNIAIVSGIGGSSWSETMRLTAFNQSNNSSTTIFHNAGQEMTSRVISSDAWIAIAFGSFGAIISLISLIVGYLTLRATVMSNKVAITPPTSEYGFVLRHEHTHFTATQHAPTRTRVAYKKDGE